jgi:hypothetical protein
LELNLEKSHEMIQLDSYSSAATLIIKIMCNQSTGTKVKSFEKVGGDKLEVYDKEWNKPKLAFER